MPVTPIPLRPYPLPPVREDAAALANFHKGGRTWFGSLDPGSNGVAAAVLAAAPATSGGKGKAKLQLPDKSLYLCGLDRVSPHRRLLVTSTYTVFRTMHKALNEPGDNWEDDEARLKALQGKPTTLFCRYYHKYGRGYSYELTAHADRLLAAIRALPATAAEEGSAELDELELEYDVATDMRHCLTLMIVMYLPADGEGKAIVAEEILAWINESNPKPSQAQLDELSSLAAPYESDSFWPCVYTCALHGRTDLVTSLFRPLLSHPNEALRSLVSSVSSLISSAPSSSNFAEEPPFIRAVQRFRARSKDLSRALDDAFASVAGVRRGAGALDADTVAELQSGLAILLHIVEGKSKTIIEAADDWLEALGGWLRWVDPAAVRDAIPEIMESILAEHPVSEDVDDDSADLSDDLVVPALQTALLAGDAIKAATLGSRVDPWLAAHMSDLFDKLGLLRRPEAPPTSPRRTRMITSSSTDSEAERRKREGDQSLRDFCVLSYGETLRSDPGLWRLVVEYFATCGGGEGLGRAKAVLKRVVVDAEALEMPDQTVAAMDMDLDVVSAVGGTVKETTDVKRERELAGKRPTIKDVMEMCVEYGLKDEALRLSKIRATQLMKARRYGSAVSYCVDAEDERLIARLTVLLMDEYILHGPEEFARLVDEIPSSLLDPDAHLFRPELFTNTGAADVGPSPGGPISYSRFGSRLAFLARYRDMHSAYANGDRAGAADVLVQLLASELAPRGWWAVLLVDACPLLEDEEALISSRDTWELLRCLEAIVAPILAQSEHRDLHGNLDYLKRIVRPPGQAPSDRRSDRDETEAALKQLQVVRHALARHLSRCLAGGL